MMMGIGKPGDATPWLHIRSQFTYHAEAVITGTRAGLSCLRDAVDAALESGTGTGNAFASDGEGYEIEVRRSSTVRGIGNPTYLDEEARSLAQLERDYLVRESKLRRKQEKEAYEALRWCRLNGNPHAQPASGDSNA